MLFYFVFWKYFLEHFILLVLRYFVCSILGLFGMFKIRFHSILHSTLNTIP